MMTREEILEATKDIVSFGVKDEDVDTYLKYIRPLPAGSIVVEIGTGRAKNCIRIGLSNPEVDIFTFDNANEDLNLGEVMYFKEISRRLRKAKVDNVYFTLGDSRTIFINWNLPIDVLNIDSSHKYESSMEEFKRWEPFVKVGGYILLHDYALVDIRVEGLQKAIDEYFRKERFEFIENLGQTQVVLKKA